MCGVELEDKLIPFKSKVEQQQQKKWKIKLQMEKNYEKFKKVLAWPGI